MSTLQAVGLNGLLTWSNQRLSTDGCDAAAHVYSSDFCDRCSIRLLPSIRGAVGRAALPSRSSLRPLAGVLDQRGGLNGHGALLQAESLQGLSLRRRRGRPLLATDGQVLNLILNRRMEISDTFAVD